MAAPRRRAVVEVDGLNATLRALRRYPKEANAALRDAATGIAERQAANLKQAAASVPDRRVSLQASTIRARRDRIPVVVVGGARRFDRLRGRPRAGDVLFGTEFGAIEGGPNAWRFPPAQSSYWLFRDLSKRHREVVQDWGAAVDRVALDWPRL